MPAIRQTENLIHFAAFKRHIGIYPGDLSLIPFKERLKNYRRTKGAIQFPINKPIDYELITDITKWRLSCVKKKVKGKSPSKIINKDVDKNSNKKVYKYESK